jgi:hypothetical protein
MKRESKSNVPVHAMKAYRWNRGMAPFIINLGTRGGEWLTQCPGCFSSGKLGNHASEGVCSYDICFCIVM